MLLKDGFMISFQHSEVGCHLQFCMSYTFWRSAVCKSPSSSAAQSWDPLSMAQAAEQSVQSKMRPDNHFQVFHSFAIVMQY
jgi:hypothetical protein